MIPTPDDIPGAAPDGFGYVYVLRFSNGTVKPGRAVDARERIGQHLYAADAWGITLTDHWVSPPAVNYKDVEQDVIRYCQARPGAKWSRREYFRGLRYSTIRNYAQRRKYDLEPYLPVIKPELVDIAPTASSELVEDVTSDEDPAQASSDRIMTCKEVAMYLNPCIQPAAIRRIAIIDGVKWSGTIDEPLFALSEIDRLLSLGFVNVPEVTEYEQMRRGIIPRPTLEEASVPFYPEAAS